MLRWRERDRRRNERETAKSEVRDAALETTRSETLRARDDEVGDASSESRRDRRRFDGETARSEALRWRRRAWYRCGLGTGLLGSARGKGEDVGVGLDFTSISGVGATSSTT
jgi:hypothetical protein